MQAQILFAELNRQQLLNEFPFGLILYRHSIYGFVLRQRIYWIHETNLRSSIFVAIFTIHMFRWMKNFTIWRRKLRNVGVEESKYQQQAEVNSKAVKELTNVKNGLEFVEQNTRLEYKIFICLLFHFLLVFRKLYLKFTTISFVL